VFRPQRNLLTKANSLYIELEILLTALMRYNVTHTRHPWGAGRNTLYRSDNRYNNNKIYSVYTCIHISVVDEKKNTNVQVQQL